MLWNHARLAEHTTGRGILAWRKWAAWREMGWGGPALPAMTAVQIWGG